MRRAGHKDDDYLRVFPTEEKRATEPRVTLGGVVTGMSESEGQEREQNGLASEICLGSSGLLSRVHWANIDWIGL